MVDITIEDYENLRPMASINVNDVKLVFCIPSRSALWRVETLFTKEPATIKWLDRIPEGAVLFDVGANVGMYTVFAAKVKKAQVFAFEPESQNYAQLTRNVMVNGVQDAVRPFCLALSDKVGLDALYLSEFAWHGAGSCHSFAAEVDYELKPRSSPFAQGTVGYTIDRAVQEQAVPIPEYIKIDVDGFEHKVLNGARETLKSPKVKSLCIEINPHLKEHLDLIDELRGLGFHYDPIQVESVARSEGPFKDLAEYIFDRADPAELRIESRFKTTTIPTQLGAGAQAAADAVIDRIEKCAVETKPFPHVVLDDLFPADYYAEMLAQFPSDDAMMPLGETGRTGKGIYQERMVTLFEDEHFQKLDAAKRAFWSEFAGWLYSERFIGAVVEKFLPWCANRLAEVRDRNGAVRCGSDALLVSDRTQYTIGPHTDAPHRLLSFLFYMPDDDRHRHLGTSFFRSKDPKFVCPGGPHYPFDRFEKLSTLEFIPNRLLVFVRTGRSFHGVEAISEPGVDRRLLINNVRLLDE